jgi:hypothetical protein
MTTTARRALQLVAMAGVLAPASAHAQLDPLLFLRTTAPNVIIAVDTANRMLRDADNTYYDPGVYPRVNAAHETLLGLSNANASTSYRRKFFDLAHGNPTLAAEERFTASTLSVVGDLDPAYGTFFERTRLAIARRGLIRAMNDNLSSARFALIKTRQANPTLPSAGNEGPVKVSDPARFDPTDQTPGKWRITRTTVTASNSSQTTTGLLTAASASGANATILTTLARNIGTAGALLPAGSDGRDIVEAPVGLLLDDARSHASTLISADAAAGGCRNTIVVLVVGGGEGTINTQNLATKASTFLNVGGRRVPIYVVALFPPAADVAALQAIAANSGGQYFEVTKAMVEATTVGSPVPEVVRAVNTAVSHAYATAPTFNTAPTADLPFGPYQEHQTTSPVVGTVNLRGASKLTDAGTDSLPDSETYLMNGAVQVPQRSNVLVTSGVQLPGFRGILRGFRVYKPVADASRPSGYKFVQDGARLWVSSIPAAASRNIFTVLPGSSTLVPFAAANVDQIDDHLNVSDPAALIQYVRSLPMGAVLGSTPAFMDPPSLDPPPDPDYPGFREDNKTRRTLIFVGTNNGMLHALDARTGVEVWAFIPFNLLPKLKALRSGQSMDAFKYFVDSSPKLSDVKVGGEWRTFLFFGQGAGGTFYNALDVTLDDMADTVAQDSTNTNALLTYFASADAIKWKWSFPRNSSFDTTIMTTTAPFGELRSDATNAEKSVGETWSDPAVGQVQNEDGPYVMLVGSGFLRPSVQSAYRAGPARAGTTFYVLNVASGEVLASRDVGADANAETVDDCRAANDCRRLKNALQMDPVATGPQDQRFVTKAYIGDLDGKVYRFALSHSAGTVSLSVPTTLFNIGADYPLFSSMAAVMVGTSQYLFVGTGSDMLPSPDAVNKPQTSSLLVLLDNGASATKTAEILLEAIDGADGDEKVSAFPAVAGDIVFFSTTTFNVTTPCTPYAATLYAFTFVGGPAYDTNGDGTLTASTGVGNGVAKGKRRGATGDSYEVFNKAGERATAPFVVDGHLAMATGGTIQMFGDPNDYNKGIGQTAVRILSWRMVR